MNATRPISLAAASLLTASLALTAAPASASGGDDDRVIKTGSCSGSADWKLKVKTDNSKLEVEGEVDSNKSGQAWAWKIKDNGVVVAKGNATTGGPSGSFSVQRRIADKSGTDRVVFKAKHAGQTCRGVIAFG
ncbi:hypothetical protein [Nocardioides dilutus]